MLSSFFRKTQDSQQVLQTSGWCLGYAQCNTIIPTLFFIECISKALVSHKWPSRPKKNQRTTFSVFCHSSQSLLFNDLESIYCPENWQARGQNLPRLVKFLKNFLHHRLSRHSCQWYRAGRQQQVLAPTHELFSQECHDTLFQQVSWTLYLYTHLLCYRYVSQEHNPSSRQASWESVLKGVPPLFTWNLFSKLCLLFSLCESSGYSGACKATEFEKTLTFLALTQIKKSLFKY